MNTLSKSIPIFIIFSLFFTIVNAQETASKDEIIAKCTKAAEIIKNKGNQEAINAVNDTSGEFIWKDTYVYIMDMNATIMAHGAVPKFIGKNLMGLKDPITKKHWYPEVYKRIKAGEKNGWFDYHWKKSEGKGIFKKHCYFVKEGDLVIFAGIYGELVK